jgi:hypothetical protein
MVRFRLGVHVVNSCQRFFYWGSNPRGWIANQIVDLMIHTSALLVSYRYISVVGSSGT